MRLVSWISKSSSPGMTRPRQFEDPTNKHLMFTFCCFSSGSRASGESTHGEPRSCPNTSRVARGFGSGSGVASGFERPGKSSLFSTTEWRLGHSRAMWPLWPQLKHCFPTWQSLFIWSVLPQLRTVTTVVAFLNIYAHNYVNSAPNHLEFYRHIDFYIQSHRSTLLSLGFPRTVMLVFVDVLFTPPTLNVGLSTVPKFDLDLFVSMWHPECWWQFWFQAAYVYMVRAIPPGHPVTADM